MEWFEYLAACAVNIEKNYPDKLKRKIEDYLDTFASLPPILRKSNKCAITALEYRDKGNVVSMAGKYEDAAMLYTNSIRNAAPYSECAAMGYALRSQAFYRLKAYADCILDIDRALNLPCKDALRVKLNSLKESAVGKLNDQSNSNTDSIDDLKYRHGENPNLPGVSLGIDITLNSQDGRRFVAKMPFKAGDVLIVQNPYLPVMELGENPGYCHHCLKKTLCLVPCDQCCYEMYCSEKCRTEAYDNYHRIECTIQFTLISALPLNTKGLICQLRCLNILTEQGATLDTLFHELNEIEENADPESLRLTDENSYGNPRKAFLSLFDDKKLRHLFDGVKNLSGTYCQAAYTATLLRNHTNFFKKNADVTLVAKILVKLSTAYAIHHFAIPYFGTTDVKARITYPLISLINHACINNTITYVDKNGRMVLRALQNIRPGDEILWSSYVHFEFEETVCRSGRTLECKRHCKQCDKVFTYPPEKTQHVKMDSKLRITLLKNPYNVEGLWKLLNIIHGKHQRYTLQALLVKSMLADAYEGRCDHVAGTARFRILGIL